MLLHKFTIEKNISGIKYVRKWMRYVYDVQSIKIALNFKWENINVLTKQKKKIQSPISLHPLPTIKRTCAVISQVEVYVISRQSGAEKCTPYRRQLHTKKETNEKKYDIHRWFPSSKWRPETRRKWVFSQFLPANWPRKTYELFFFKATHYLVFFPQCSLLLLLFVEIVISLGLRHKLKSLFFWKELKAVWGQIVVLHLLRITSWGKVLVMVFT